MNLEGTAPIDLGPPPPRKPHFADPLNGEVIYRHIELPADVTMTVSGIMHQLHGALLETLLMRRTQGDRARCIQIHIHYPESNDQFISHEDPAAHIAFTAEEQGLK